MQVERVRSSAGRDPDGRWLLSAFLVLSAAGCGGSAEINFTSLHTSEIDPPSTELHQFHPHQAYWWIDKDKKINIAFHDSVPRTDKLLRRVRLDMMITPGEPPAGSGRDYQIRGPQAVVAVRSPFATVRSQSYSGVMSVIVKDERRIRGSFRLWMRSNEPTPLFTFVPKTPGPVVCFGTFEAIRDEKKGREVHDRLRVPAHPF